MLSTATRTKFQIKAIVTIPFLRNRLKVRTIWSRAISSALGPASAARSLVKFSGRKIPKAMYDSVASRDGKYAQRMTSAYVKSYVHVKARGSPEPKRPDQVAEEIRAIEGRLTRTGRPGKVSPLKPDIGCYFVNTFRSDKPLISVVIPTAGRIVDIEGRRVDLVLNSVEASNT